MKRGPRRDDASKPGSLRVNDFEPQSTSDKNRDALYEEVHVFLHQVFISVRNQKRFDLDWGFQIMNEIVQFHAPNDTLFLNAIHSEELYDYVVRHSVNVAIFSTAMAKDLGYEGEKLIEIGMVGLLHDVGIGLIPEEIVHKKAKLSDREYEVMKERPHFSYKILKRFSNHPYLAECALQVYERVDGSGYPKGLKGDEIHEYAQIVGLAAVYEALIHSRPQREKFLHFMAAKEIIKTGKRSFKREHLKALLNIFSVFPLNSHVKLNSGAIGKVLQTYRDQPMRPKLQVIYDSQSRKVLTERIVDLQENPLLYITDAVSGEELHEISRKEQMSAKMGRGEVDKSFIATFGTTVEQLENRDVFYEEVSEKSHSLHSEARSKPIRTYVLLGLALCLALIAGWHFGLTDFVLQETPDAAAPQPPKTETAYRIPEPPEKTNKNVEKQKPESESITEENVDVGEPASSGLTDPDALPETSPKMEDTPSEPIGNDLSEPIEKNVPDILVSEEPGKPPETSFDKAVSLVDIDAAVTIDPLYPFSIKLTYFKTKEEAENALPGFGKLGLSPYWVKVNLGDEGTWYRVFAGHFSTVGDARRFLEQHDLSGVAVKKTRYANLIGVYDDEDIAGYRMEKVREKGFSPYFIMDPEGNFNLFVGAFYTHLGAEDQFRDLENSGIGSRIVERGTVRLPPDRITFEPEPESRSHE